MGMRGEGGGGGSGVGSRAGEETSASLCGGGWRLVAVGGWQLMVGGWWLVAVGGGWWLVAVGGGWWLVAVGGWWSLGAVLKGCAEQNKIGVVKDSPGPRSCLWLSDIHSQRVFGHPPAGNRSPAALARLLLPMGTRAPHRGPVCPHRRCAVRGACGALSWRCGMCGW